MAKKKSSKSKKNVKSIPIAMVVGIVVAIILFYAYLAITR